MNLEQFTPEEKETIDTYNRAARQWARQRTRHFAEFPAKLKQHLPFGKIIELGCGDGQGASEIIKEGYDYVGTDVSQALVKIAQERVPRGTFMQSSIYELPFEKETFDGFWASAVLLHIPKNRMNEAFNEIKRVCKKGAVGFISLKEGIGEKITDENFDGIPAPRFFSFYQDDEFKQIVKQNELDVVDSGKIVSNITGTTWLYYFVKKI